MNSADLAELAKLANRHHGDAQLWAQTALESAWHAGKALLAAKRQCDHGDWLPWLSANFDGSRSTANGYMRIAKNVQRVEHLDAEQPLREALKGLTKTQRASREPERPVDSWLRRLDNLAKDAREMAEQLLSEDLSPERLQEIVDHLEAPLATLNALRDRLRSDGG